jgi:hypothetical protein
VAGDEIYGDNPHLRATLEDRRIGYVVAVSSSHQVVTPAGKFPTKALVARIPKRAWQQRSAGASAKGERYYDWAQADIHGPAGRPGHWWMLVRRNRRTRLLPMLLTPSGSTARAGARGRAALDGRGDVSGRQGPGWPGRALGLPLDLLAPMGHTRSGTCFTVLISPSRDLTHRLRWSHWRRRHQARARNSHYRRQACSTMKNTIYGWSSRQTAVSQPANDQGSPER